MYEVFNAMTGETVGYLDHRAAAAVHADRLTRRTGVMHDYIDADTDPSGWIAEYDHGYDDHAVQTDHLESPEPWCPHGTDPSCACLDQWDDLEPAI